MSTTTSTVQPSGEAVGTEPPRLVVAAPALDHADLRQVIEAFCSFGDRIDAALVVAGTDRPEDMAPALLAACTGLDLAAAGPIDLVHLDDVAPLGAGELGLFLGGDGGAANLAGALHWLAVRAAASGLPVPTAAAPAVPAPSRPAPRRGNPPLAVVLGHPDDEAGRLAHLQRELGDDRETTRRLGRPGRGDALARVAQVCRPLDWIDGYLSLTDAQFLYDVVAAVRPTRVIEVGSASGYSAAVILRALADAQVPLTAADGRPAVLSFDIATQCYWDTARRVGSAVAELVPDLAHGAAFVTGTAVDAAALPPASASMAFIDANHDHPWATLDLLLLARVLRPGSWVVLHDVRLAACGQLYGELTGTGTVWSQHGAQHLYDHWPYERLIERIAPSTNIAAIRLPVDRTIGLADVHDGLALPWEGRVPDDVLAAVRALDV